MGLIKQTEQDNGNVLLEIIYGGREAPFGGVDSSAPPAYIDPRCFAAADGFLVIDNKLVVAQLAPIVTPTLWSSVANVRLLKFGTFYNSLTGQLNYAFGVTINAIVGPPSGVAYKFYLTAWNPANPAVNWTDILPISLFDAVAVEEQASITLDSIATNVASTNVVGSGGTFNITSVNSTGGITGITVAGGSSYSVGMVLPVTSGGIGNSGYVKVTGVTAGALNTAVVIAPGTQYSTGAGNFTGTAEVYSSCSLVINGPAGGPFTYTIQSWASGYTRQQLVASMVAQINGTPDPNVVASASVDGYSIILTALTAGVAGNTITVQDTSANSTATLAPPFYFSNRVARNLEGGQLTQSAQAPRVFNGSISTVDVGGTTYFANLGPMILKYSGPGYFTTSSLYNGMAVLRKFAGSLIGLRQINQLGVFTENQDMIFAWTAAEDLDEWSPVKSNGDVTGAGFAELADIGDYLSGLVVSGATAFIIRSQGLSYATATGSGSLPFDFNHIGLGDQGEGAQIQQLVAQYDQTGCFVGNTDVFQISGQVSSIGAKIKAALFASLTSNQSIVAVLDANICVIFLGGDQFPLLIFSTGAAASPANSYALFLYNANNSTWTVLTFPAVLAAEPVRAIDLGTLYSINDFSGSDEYNISVPALAVRTNLITLPPAFYALIEGVPNNSAISNPAYITFPQEEVSHGRDITIDALYLSLWANVSAPTLIGLVFNGFQVSAASTPGEPDILTPMTVPYATLFLQPTDFNTLEGDPLELQFFSSNLALGAGAATMRSPQLTLQVYSIATADTAQIRISKVSIFGSYDPAQRPV
jgi:hypothetical protein